MAQTGKTASALARLNEQIAVSYPDLLLPWLAQCYYPALAAAIDAAEVRLDEAIRTGTDAAALGAYRDAMRAGVQAWRQREQPKRAPWVDWDAVDAGMAAAGHGKVAKRKREAV